MIATIQPSAIQGAIQAPTSKSSMQRACAAALLTNGVTVIKNPGNSNDDRAALGVIRGLGAYVEQLTDGSLKITSKGVNPDAGAVNCGESGLGIRMFTPLVALSNKNITINGEGSLLTRPMDFFDTVLPQLGVEIVSNGGKLPLQVKGPLKPAAIEVDGSLSSQFLTGLLFAYAASGASDVALTVKDLKSKPYIDLTLQVMKHFGWEVENRNYEQFYFAEAVTKQPTTESIQYTVEGDWSGGAFLLVAGAIAGDITVKGLDVYSTQADKAILQALMSSGAKMSVQTEQIEIGPAPLKAFHFNATECPDLFPPLVALASYCEGKTVIEGANRLTHKESNRALTLQEEFGKMGIQIDLQDDLMIVHGGTGVNGAATNSHHDHRIAMACAVAGLKATSATTIADAQAINKSYPDFYQHIQQLGASVKIAQ
ncbi:3-phosphoshikimate 1-carboxyvinyltransferase [Paraflavitalea pollutisoli]|uniref:3-phosphoshikimate 1-carboxyvinyltransferase n=1 Tax=Paraflavitalea pollutisoli TaxID=3034143 RepID=UPI0023EB5CAD|nr:3-phosphoshikimate 1-carboxyvinyltransferase [Paraflavitalea sp. H1-2-19X]